MRWCGLELALARYFEDKEVCREGMALLIGGHRDAKFGDIGMVLDYPLLSIMSLIGCCADLLCEQ
jgi:hypothetical protein